MYVLFSPFLILFFICLLFLVSSLYASSFKCVDYSGDDDDDGVAGLSHSLFCHVQLFGWLIFFRSFVLVRCCCLSKLNIIQQKDNTTIHKNQQQQSYGTDTEQA